MFGVEGAFFGSAKIALRLKYEIQIGWHIYNSMYGAGYKVEKWNEKPMI